MTQRIKLSLIALLAIALCTLASAFGVRPTQHPYAAHALERARWSTLEGAVVERVSAGPYCYLRIHSDTGEVWVAALAATSAQSERVKVTVIGRAHQFESRRLHRTFDTLLFGIVRTSERHGLQIASKK